MQESSLSTLGGSRQKDRAEITAIVWAAGIRGVRGPLQRLLLRFSDLFCLSRLSSLLRCPVNKVLGVNQGPLTIGNGRQVSFFFSATV